jgi:large subunit ribosomal protein L24
MRSSPHSPRRQRKALYTAATFERRRRMTVPLSRDLRKRFRLRSLPVRKGDTVRVLSGSFVGREERVAKVDRRSYAVVLDNVTLKTGEDKLKPLPLRTSHLVLTKLNLSDPWRRRTLQVSDEDVSPEERGELAEGEEAAEPETAPEPVASEPATPAAPKPKRAPKKPAVADPAEGDDVDEPDSPSETEDSS